MNELDSPVLITIAACEVGFWVLVLGGLVIRYPLRGMRASTVILACVPLLDVILLVAVGIDLFLGGEVGLAHRLAPIYLGCTIMFGPRMIRWADQRFAHRFAHGPAPRRVPASGAVRKRYEWAEFGRWLGAAGIAAVITLGLGFTVADAAQREQLFSLFGMLGVVTVIWLLTGPVWYLGGGD